MIRRALAVVAVTVLAGATLPASAAPDPVTAIHEATNKARADHGLAPLTRSRCLDDTAQKWTDHMAYEGRLVHSPLNLSTCGLTSAGENIDFNSGTPAEVVQGWLDSPGHRANLLNPTYTTLGAGWNDRYATQQFGSGETVTQPDRATPPTRTATPSRGLAKTGR